MENAFVNKKCVPCEGGVTPYTKEEAQKNLAQFTGWLISDDGKKLKKDFSFKNFAEALVFANTVGKIAESENHHPDINIHGWNKVTITLSTHAIDGLSENDFILAAKIDDR